MSVKTYWKGEGIRLGRLWRDFDDGPAYMQNVAASELHLLRLTFARHPPQLPLFDFEVVFKTVKGTFRSGSSVSLPSTSRHASAAVGAYA